MSGSGCMSEEAAITYWCTRVLSRCWRDVPHVFLQGEMVVGSRLCPGGGLQQGEARAFRFPRWSLPCADLDSGSWLSHGSWRREQRGKRKADPCSLQHRRHSAPSFLPDLPVTSIPQPGPSTEWGEGHRPPSVPRGHQARQYFSRRPPPSPPPPPPSSSPVLGRI